MVVYVSMSREEHDLLQALARRDGVNLCQWVRECINDRLLEEGDDVPLLQIRDGKRER